MVPDLAHLLPRSPWTDHTALSLVTFSLPLGWLLSLWIERVLGRGWARLAPAPWRAALLRLFALPTPLAHLAAAVLLGAATHVGVDHFTHGYGVGTWLLGLQAALPGTDLPWSRGLQYGLGIAGTWAVLRGLARWDKRERSQALRVEDVMPVCILLLGLALLSASWGHHRSWWLPFGVRVHDFAVESVACGLVLSTILAVLFGVLGVLLPARSGNEEVEERGTTSP